VAGKKAKRVKAIIAKNTVTCFIELLH